MAKQDGKHHAHHTVITITITNAVTWYAASFDLRENKREIGLDASNHGHTGAHLDLEGCSPDKDRVSQSVTTPNFHLFSWVDP